MSSTWWNGGGISSTLGIGDTYKQRTAQEQAEHERWLKLQREAKEARAATIRMVQSEFSELMPRMRGSELECLTEILSKARWLAEDHRVHQIWQAALEQRVRVWSMADHAEFHAWCASYAWADQVEGTPDHLRAKAPTARAMLRKQRDDSLAADAAKRDQEQRALAAAEREERRRQAEAARAEQERLAAERQLATLIEDSALEAERGASGAGEW